MTCQVKNHSNVDLSSLEPHVQGMYDFFDQKLGFQKPPVMVFDSDPSNQSKVLGKTAYYDPQSLEIHVFVDGRHPKDMLRSIAHELIHHQQNLEGRLNVGGYMGEGYYLKNEAMRELEQEAMLEGNALMREYEDNLKLEEKTKMSLKEWKNNELNKNLLKKFGILNEEKMPMKDEPEGKDLNKDGKKGHGKVPAFLEEEVEEDLDKLKGGLKDYMKKKMGDKEPKKEKEEIDEASCGMKEEEKESLEEGMCPKCSKQPCVCPKNEGLQESINKILKAKRINLNGKRIK